MSDRYLSVRTAIEAAAAALVAFALVLIVFGPIWGALDTPLGAGDLYATYVNADNWAGFGSATTTHYGFPFGMDLNLTPNIDITENAVARLIDLATGSPFLGINLVLLASFPAVAVLAYLLLRIVSRGGPVAVALAVAFTMIPYHFGRGLGHTYLATMYGGVAAVILATLIGLGILPGVVHHGERWRRAVVITGTALLVILTAWSGLYYAAFGVILGLAAVLWRVLRGDGWRRLLAGLAVPAAIGVLALIGFIPALWAAHQSPTTAALTERSAFDSVTYAGSLTMSLIPAPISQLPGMWRYNNAITSWFEPAPPLESTALTNYGTWVTTACALVFIIGAIIRARRGTLRMTSVPLIAWLTAVVVLFLVPWGLGFLTANLLTAQIRAWNRLLPILLLLLVAGAMAVLARTRADRLHWSTAAAAAVITVVVAVEQVAPFRAAYAEGARQGGAWLSTAQAYSAALNAAIPEHCGVLQLPYAQYPEQGTIAPALDDYSHFLQPLVDNDKDFSYGAVKNTEASALLSSLALPPTPGEVDTLRELGFCAIHVDRRGIPDAQWGHLSADLVSRFGEPVAVGADGTWLAYDIRSPAS